MNQFRTRIVLLLLATLMAGGYLIYPKSVVSTAYAQATQESEAAYQQLRTANNLSEAFKHVANALRPSVVSISTESRPRNVSVRRFQMPTTPFGLSPFLEDDILERFQSFELPQKIPGRQGLGSGVIVREDGHILTNHHVIKQADKIEVTLFDDQSYEARVIGSDPETDLAVLKIEASGLQPVRWADSDSAEVGEWVVAVGSPFGLTQTVTSGIISALGRDDMGIANFENFIQTDAAINPGNSGGPLVNLHGELLGINTAIASRNGNFNGIGFAIPSSMANRVMTSIMDHGAVSRGYLGVMIQDLTDDMAASFDFDGKGVLIGDVVAGGPGDNAGLQAGDIVIKLNGHEAGESSQLRNRIAELDPGTTVNLEVMRNGMSMQLDVTLGNRNQTQLASWQGDVGSATDRSPIGISVRPLSDEMRQQAGIADGGVVVTDADPSGLAWRAGIRRGDVVVAINGSELQSLRDYEKAMESVDISQGVRLRVSRDGATRFVFLKGN